MTYEFRWRRAVTVSVIVHVFLLVGSGYMAANLFAVPTIPEQYLELTLVNEPQIEDTEDSAAPQPQMPMAAPVSPVIPQIKTPAPVPKAVAPVSDMAAVTDQVQPVAGNSAPSYVPAAPAGGKPAAGIGSGSGSGKKSGGVIPPGVLDPVKAKYPQAARQAGIEGAVTLKVKVLANGCPGDVMITRSSGHGMLDNAAVAAIKQWRFVPAKDRESGRAIECYTTIPVTFRLDS